MAWTKTKTAIVAGAVLLLAAGITTTIAELSRHPVITRYSSGEAFRAESIRRINAAKQISLAFILFASDHDNQYPKNFEQVKTMLPKNISTANWEIMSGGDMNSIRDPAATILLREKDSMQTPDGSFLKVYAFTDGHVERRSASDNDFASMEKQAGFQVNPAPK